MKLNVAQSPLPPAGQDRVFTDGSSVVVLDGATQMVRSYPPVEMYVDTLGATLLRLLAQYESKRLKEVLARAIKDVASELKLTPGGSPSSTVAILRASQHVVDALVLGDTSIVVGRSGSHYSVLSDTRLSQLPIPARDAYRARLRQGCGFDAQHHTLQKDVQIDLMQFRNKPGGFFVAEAEPTAASHAFEYRFARKSITYIVVATDGIFDPISHLDMDDWESLARKPHDVPRVLATCDAWEREADPTGRILPRAKRHDDKTLVVLTSLS